MARLIPAFIDVDAPAGEQDVFNMIAGGPPDWTVLHSLDLAPWRESKRTEVDFVVIMPDTGILCIEVKSHSAIEFAGGRWSPASIRKSPFKQSLDARFALQRGLGRLAEHARSIPFGSCCIFPNARFALGPNLSVSPSELMDVAAFRSLRSAAEFASDLRKRLEAIIDADRQHRLQAPLSQARVDDLVALCLPVQRRRPSASEEIARRRRQVEELLRQPQKPVLELAALNPRLLVTGAAGTGKTLVAMELAQRCADAGERVALVCFNRLIGKWMKQQCEARGSGPNLSVDSASRLLVRLANIAVPPDADDVFWGERVPLAVEERLTDPEFEWEARFDVLVVDEVQDILARPALWQCLLALLAGGAKDGRFMLFGDLQHQVLKDGLSMRAAFAELLAQASLVRWHMGENCRNPRTVAEAALALSGMPDTTYTGYLRIGAAATDVKLEPVESDDEALARVRKLIGDARTRGYRERDITLLSFAADERSVARALVGQGMRLMPADKAEAEIRYALVYAYKGMENEIVILTDTRVDMGELGRSLFYTAFTRATSQVAVVCRKADAATLVSWLTGGAP